jgi:hypothetical protein
MEEADGPSLGAVEWHHAARNRTRPGRPGEPGKPSRPLDPELPLDPALQPESSVTVLPEACAFASLA